MGYSTQSNVEAVFGADNIAQWGQINPDDDANDVATAVTNAIAWADAEIDGVFTDGPYPLPFAPVPTLVQHWSAVLAGAYLYRRRGIVQDMDDEGNKVEALTKEVRHQMGWYVSGSKRLQQDLSHDGPTSPQVVY